MTTLHATPYNLDATGFYFESMEEYQAKSENHLDRYGNKVEELEMQFIDGDDAALFEACRINQSNLNIWFNDVECLQDYEKINLYYLVSCAGYTLSQGLDKLDEPSITESSLKDAATELFDECWLPSIPENVRYYIDYASFASDCQLGGDMTEFEYAGNTYTCTNASGI
ncbi:antirestriction protein ArdA [Methylotenera sp.]|uniref:antirestriction protein ArdA n=1 Tax=Methylotenera sp. TaxID=2051956 RepID=UPI0027302B13|nr:antirestriction protein ArdA [Methylotenera sp.]MDP2229940.1 antirestriction protein ArdA [Methylotenera sp.]